VVWQTLVPLVALKKKADAMFWWMGIGWSQASIEDLFFFKRRNLKKQPLFCNKKKQTQIY